MEAANTAAELWNYQMKAYVRAPAILQVDNQPNKYQYTVYEAANGKRPSCSVWSTHDYVQAKAAALVVDGQIREYEVLANLDEDPSLKQQKQTVFFDASQTEQPVCDQVF